MIGHKICFNREICLIIPNLSLLPLLIWSTVLMHKPPKVDLTEISRNFKSVPSQQNLLQIIIFYIRSCFKGYAEVGHNLPVTAHQSKDTLTWQILQTNNCTCSCDNSFFCNKYTDKFKGQSHKHIPVI